MLSYVSDEVLLMKVYRLLTRIKACLQKAWFVLPKKLRDEFDDVLLMLEDRICDD
jgi:hypothetical protein